MPLTLSVRIWKEDDRCNGRFWIYRERSNWIHTPAELIKYLLARL